MKKNHFKIFNEVSLFEGIAQNDIEAMLKCLGSTVKSYSKDEIIIHVDSPIDAIGIVLDGEVLITKEDFAGNRSILTRLGAGEVFGEVIVCAGIHSSPVTVIATTKCEVMFIGFNRIISSCSSSCSFHTSLIENMLRLIANKNLMLNNKIEFLSKRTIREKLSVYLLEQLKKAGSNYFDIHFNRNELADFLCVDRSALSRELGRMRDEELIEFDKNNFKLLDIEGLNRL